MFSEKVKRFLKIAGIVVSAVGAAIGVLLGTGCSSVLDKVNFDGYVKVKCGDGVC